MKKTKVSSSAKNRALNVAKKEQLRNIDIGKVSKSRVDLEEYMEDHFDFEEGYLYLTLNDMKEFDIKDKAFKNIIDDYENDDWIDEWFTYKSISQSILKKFKDDYITKYVPFNEEDFSYHISGDKDNGLTLMIALDLQDEDARIKIEKFNLEEIESFDDAINHESHRIRFVTFKEVLNYYKIEYEEAGSEYAGSQYLYIQGAYEDTDYNDRDEIKVRFSDHANQSGLHRNADWNFHDGVSTSPERALEEIISDPQFLSKYEFIKDIPNYVKENKYLSVGKTDMLKEWVNLIKDLDVIE